MAFAAGAQKHAAKFAERFAAWQRKSRLSYQLILLKWHNHGYARVATAMAS
jgi:hypothetical protein